MMNCETCLARATEMALDNYLDANGLRMPHPTYPGVTLYEEEKVDKEELAQWTKALLRDNGSDWHREHVPAKIAVQCDHCPDVHEASYSHDGTYGEGPIYAAACTADGLTDYHTLESDARITAPSYSD